MLGHALILSGCLKLLRQFRNEPKIEYGRMTIFSACFLQGRGHGRSHMHMEVAEGDGDCTLLLGLRVIVADPIYM